MTRRVCVSGAFSTGKTTLVHAAARRLRAEGEEPAVIEEVARSVLAEGYKLDREATSGSYLHYMRLQLAAEWRVRAARTALSDRSLVDLLAYVEVNADPRIPHELVDLLREVVRHETGFFDLYCYLPVEFRPVGDGVREVDQTYQRAVAARLRALLDEYQVPVVEVRGDLETRVGVVLAALRAGDDPDARDAS